jgi:hypothetical protein
MKKPRIKATNITIYATLSKEFKKSGTFGPSDICWGGYIKGGGGGCI